MTDAEFRFRGTERVTIEVAGTFDRSKVVLPADCEHDGGTLSLFAFAVVDLRVAGVPLARWTYTEVLWRVAVRHRGVPAWWAIACDLESRVPRFAARHYVRYPVRPFVVDVTDTFVRTRGEAGELAIAVQPTTAAAEVEPRALRTGHDAAWLVPWGDDGLPAAVGADFRVETDTLSAPTLGTEVSWNHAMMRRGREHRCGVARR